MLLAPARRHSADTAPGDGVAARLDRLRGHLAAGWAEPTPLARRLDTLRERLRTGRFQLAVLGQVKRGKSTFLNALLGEALLPAGVIPLTAIATFIAWAPSPRLRVAYHDRTPDEFTPAGAEEIRERLFGLVSEEANPHNRLGVDRVDLFYPAEILRDGVVLIDTPGIGSSHRHNTDAALAVLPECDAALFVVSVEPPITEVELAYLDTVRPRMTRLFFVLNKIDQLETEDRDTAFRFLRSTLQQHTGAAVPPRIFQVSALGGLKARGCNDPAALDASGIAEIGRYLRDYLAREKIAALHAAVQRKAADIAAEAAADLALRIRMLELPVEDLEARTRQLEQALAEIAVQGRMVHDLLAGDRKRAIEELEAHAERLRQDGREHLSGVLSEITAAASGDDIEAAAEAAIAAAIPEFFERELGATARAFRHSVETLLAAHHRCIEDLVNLVRRTAAELFDVPYAGSAGAEEFRLGQEPYWVTQRWNNTFASVPADLAARLLPAGLRRRRILTRLDEQASELVQRNVENLRWATRQGLDDTFRRFAAMFDERLAEAIAATQGAASAAAARRNAVADHTDTALGELQGVAAALVEIAGELADGATQPAA